MINCFMKVDDIAGESRDPAHRGWIDLLSLGFVSSRNPAPGGKAISVQELQVVKRFDSSSPRLALFCAQAKHIPAVEIHLHHGQGLQEYKLRDVVISAYQHGGNANASDVPMEAIRLNYAQIQHVMRTQHAAAS